MRSFLFKKPTGALTTDEYVSKSNTDGVVQWKGPGALTTDEYGSKSNTHRVVSWKGPT
ncbi:hypothetical protein FCV25MIE_01736, partial [Fagus crenata]